MRKGSSGDGAGAGREKKRHENRFAPGFFRNVSIWLRLMVEIMMKGRRNAATIDAKRTVVT